MMHPDIAIVEVGGPLGHGVVATALIPRGTIIWTLGPNDIVLPPGAPELADPELQAELPRHAYVDAKGRLVFCRDAGRYMNHSCEPTTTSIGTLCDIALRDIRPGEPLNCDYALLNLEGEFACACGAPGCRGVVTQRDLPARAPQIDALVGKLVDLVPKVPQPLRAHMLNDDAERLGRVLTGAEGVPSILENVRAK
jgi:hypothetical protein